MNGKDEQSKPAETARIMFTEMNSPNFEVSLTLKRLMYDGQTPFQKLQIIETHQFGKTLVLDGKTQSSMYDEFAYHESLVQPAMLMHPNPKTVYIGGGGELATAREVLKHKSVEKCVMVDIDKDVVEFCKTELPEWHKGCIDDPRLEVIYGDAYAGIEDTDLKFDVVILDIADPIEAGPGIAMYTQEFYKLATSRMTTGGVFVTQSGSCSLYNFEESFSAIHNTLKHSWDFVKPYKVNIPSFAGDWGFNLAYNKSDDATIENYENWEPSKIDQGIAKRLGEDELKFYDGIAHRGMFNLEKPFRVGLAKEKRIITKANPVFMF